VRFSALRVAEAGAASSDSAESDDEGDTTSFGEGESLVGLDSKYRGQSHTAPLRDRCVVAGVASLLLGRYAQRHSRNLSTEAVEQSGLERRLTEFYKQHAPQKLPQERSHATPRLCTCGMFTHMRMHTRSVPRCVPSALLQVKRACEAYTGRESELNANLIRIYGTGLGE
jgi:hypothetical protein